MILLLDKFVEPEHSLQERHLLRESAALVCQIALDAEAVLDVRVERHLVRDAHILEDVLGLPPLLGGEDHIRFYTSSAPPSPITHCVRLELTSSSNAQWPLYPLQLLDLNEARVRSEPSIQSARLQPSADILSSKAVPNSTEPLDTELAAQVLDDSAEDRIHVMFTRHLFGFPAGEVEVLGHGEGDLIALEDVRDDGVVTVSGELVGDTEVR